MIKNFLFVLICIFGLNISMCSAKILNADQAAIGGITIGSNENYIKSIYGEPNNIFKREGNAQSWFYGDSFIIDFVDGKVSSIISSGANGLSTPDGISVGMTKKSLKTKYGNPNHSENYKKRSIQTYEIDENIKMIFVIKNKTISEIRINR